ncbi:MAG: hypothetical protein JNN18_07945 [Rubrivivax sp.]|nr:hypothetical protein [Rubrivivax sp.]
MGLARTRGSSTVSSSPAAIAFRWALVPFLAVTAALAVIGGPLKGPEAPHGIITLELCAFTADCAAILRAWSASQREAAMLSLGLDYLYLVLYPTVLGSALLVVARRLPVRLHRPARVLVGLVAIAGVLDGIENYFLIRLLMTGLASPYALPAAVCATGKFAILAGCLACLLAGLGLSFRRRGDG